jgi:peptide/nickel transport system ATP-binding protein
LSAPAPLLEITDLSVSYGDGVHWVQALQGVSLTLARGEVLGVVGETGSGKSTLGYAALGELSEGARLDAGSVMFDGVDVLAAKAPKLRSLRSRQVGFVAQNPAEVANPSLKIGQQLTESIRVQQGVAGAEATRRAIELLERVQLQDPVGLLERYPHELSGGQLQRVMIAMALLTEPELIVMDEPTTGLDVTVEASVLDLLEDLKSEFGIAILYIAHNLGVIARLCDRVSVMYGGEIVELASSQAIFHAPRHPYTVGLLEAVPRADRPIRKGGLRSIEGVVTPARGVATSCLFAARCHLAVDACRAMHPLLEQVRPAHEARCLRSDDVRLNPTVSDAAAEEARAGDGPPRLVVEGLRAWYGGTRVLGGAVKAVDGVDLRIDEGRVLAVVGESGCGKSTLGSTIAGLRPATAGRVEFMGRDVTKPVGRRGRETQQLLQMVFQDHGSTLNPSSRIDHITARPLRLFRVVSRRSVRETVSSLLGAVGLGAGVARRRPAQLSGGQRQRVAIARAFASRPALVICDEITSALDVSVQAAILNLLLDLQREQGTSLLFISHDLGVVRYLADDVLVMYLGRIVESGSAADVFGGPNHPYTEALLSAVPVPDPRVRPARIRLVGSPPSAAAPPGGCPFHTRCPRRIGPICDEQEPPIVEPRRGHRIRCHLPVDELPTTSFSASAPPADSELAS